MAAPETLLAGHALDFLEISGFGDRLAMESAIAVDRIAHSTAVRPSLPRRSSHEAGKARQTGGLGHRHDAAGQRLFATQPVW